ncbi:MAG: pyridoxal-phosphate dependent enzyme, partial [Acidobacteriota bacterium]
SGTFMGNSKRLKQDMPHVKRISAQPSSGFHGLEGLKHIPTAIVPGIYDETLADENLWLETEDAYTMTRWLGKNEGLLVGMSSGANVHAAETIAKRLVAEGSKGVIVTILCDGATKYLSEPFWND